MNETKTIFSESQINVNLSTTTEFSMFRAPVLRTAEACFKALGPLAHMTDGSYCRGVWDTVMCWPAAKAGSVIRLPCPPLPGLIKENKAYKICGPSGLWETREKGVFTNDIGYTHYTECYSKEALETYMKYLGNKTLAEKEFIKDIITTSRTLEIVGLCISLITTIISLFIFWYFSTLKCHRTRIHKNLFVAMIVQISMRIILYVDQLVARETGGKIAGAASGDSNTIYDTPIFCEILYSLLEYTKTVKFMWMFVEGIYLHNMIAVSVFSGKPNYVIFYTIGWGFPVLLTVAWVIPMARINTIRCWFGYYMNPLIWIIEGPRAAVMAVNLFFLLNIIRVLVMKLRESETNEADKLRKAVKAAIVLLPLLGLTNFVIMLEPDGHDWVKFSVYSFSTSFLNASEGFFISLLYCFLNGEVRQACKRQWYRWRQHRLIHSSSLRRMSRSLSIFTSFTEVPHPISSQKSNQTVNGEPSESEVPHSRFSVIFKARHSRRQSSRDLGSVLGPRSMSDVPDLPDIVTCRTDLMCEEKV